MRFQLAKMRLTDSKLLIARRAKQDVPRRESVAVDRGIAGVVVGLGVVLGLVAATWAARTPLSPLLASSAVRGGGGHGRMRPGMVVAQVALSLVLLTSGELARRRLRRASQAALKHGAV